MNMKEIEKQLKKYLKVKYNIIVEDNGYTNIFLNMNKLCISVYSDNELNKKLEEKFKEVVCNGLSGTRLYSIPYELDEESIRKAVLLTAQDNLEQLKKKINDFPYYRRDNILKKLDSLNADLDIALTLVD